MPAIFTPGDNDWVDCDRPKNGSYDSLGRLDYERALFFSTPYSLGQHKIFQEVQLDKTCLSVGGPAACVENRRINVSASFFLSIEFQDTGYLVERIYKAAYGDATSTSGFPSQHLI